MPAPAKTIEASPELKTPTQTSPPLMPLERIAKTLTGTVSPTLPNPIDSALEKINR